MSDTSKQMAELVWKDLSGQIQKVRKDEKTLQIRTERAETAGGHPAVATLAEAPTIAGGATGLRGGDQLWIGDAQKPGEIVGTGLIAFYDPATDSWMTADGSPVNGVSGVYPKRWTGWHNESIGLNDTIIPVFNTSQRHSFFARQNALFMDGDSFTQSFMLRSGTYSMIVLGSTTTDEPILDWYLDGVLQLAGQDWYSAVQVFNVEKVVPLTVISNGYHILRAVINGKNAASTNFIHRLTSFSIIPSMD